MNHSYWLAACMLACGPAMAQDATVQKLKQESARMTQLETDSVRTWKKGGIYNLNGSQGSLSNWAAGGDAFSLAVNTSLNLFSYYKSPRHNWDNTLDLNFGYVRSSTLGSRKNDDRIDLLSKYGFVLSKHLNLALLLNFRSQLLRGYTYSEAGRSFSSTFLSPAYVLTSCGLDYKPTKHLSIFVSPATARWIIVKNDSLSAKGLYGVEPGRHSVLEIGAFATINYWKDLTETLNYKGRLDLYSNYRHKPGNVDVFFTNQLSLKLWKILAATWNIDMIYDDDARVFGPGKDRPALQLKSLVGLGLQARF